MKLKLLACALLIIAASTQAMAHHSSFMFDGDAEVPLEATVDEFDWTNPHAYLYITVEGADGTKAPWVIELNAPRSLINSGWRPDSVAPGDHVTLVVNPLRNGLPGGDLVTIRLPSGEELEG